MSVPVANPSRLSPEHRDKARELAVRAATLGYHNAPLLHYTQEAGPRWEGIHDNLKAWRGQFPRHADCSAFVTWCLWNGLSHFHHSDNVNGENWQYGYTGTEVKHGVPVPNGAMHRKADAVLYGDPFGGTGHTALVVGHRNGKLMVISFGSEAGPFYLPYDYRRDIHSIRRYI